MYWKRVTKCYDVLLIYKYDINVFYFVSETNKLHDVSSRAFLFYYFIKFYRTGDLFHKIIRWSDYWIIKTNIRHNQDKMSYIYSKGQSLPSSANEDSRLWPKTPPAESRVRARNTNRTCNNLAVIRTWQAFVPLPVSLEDEHLACTRLLPSGQISNPQDVPWCMEIGCPENDTRVTGGVIDGKGDTACIGSNVFRVRDLKLPMWLMWLLNIIN